MREAAKTDLVPCTVCGRTFNLDRIEKHQAICERNNKNNKEKTLRAEAKHPIAGQLNNSSVQLREGARAPLQKSMADSQTGAALFAQGTSETTTKTTDWRSKSQGLREFIRSAKNEATTEQPEQRVQRVPATDWRKQSQGLRDFLRAARGDGLAGQPTSGRTGEQSLDSKPGHPLVASAA